MNVIRKIALILTNGMKIRVTALVQRFKAVHVHMNSIIKLATVPVHANVNIIGNYIQKLAIASVKCKNVKNLWIGMKSSATARAFKGIVDLVRNFKFI